MLLFEKINVLLTLEFFLVFLYLWLQCCCFWWWFLLFLTLKILLLFSRTYCFYVLSDFVYGLNITFSIVSEALIVSEQWYSENRLFLLFLHERFFDSSYFDRSCSIVQWSWIYFFSFRCLGSAFDSLQWLSLFNMRLIARVHYLL